MAPIGGSGGFEEIKPGANMPTLGLSGKELNDLVAYLESLK